MYKFLAALFLLILYNSLTVDAQVFSLCGYPTGYACEDMLDTDSVCMVIFNGSNPNNGTIDPKCQNSTYTQTMLQCAYTCGACCKTPAYDCQNAAPPNPFDCNALTVAQCKQAAAQAEYAQYCPATCGLCQVGSCADTIDCTGLSAACFDPSTQAFMATYCARTCGCGNSTNTVGGVTTAPAVNCVDNNANCATWNSNGFCASTFYTQAQKAQYCPLTCNLCSLVGKK